MVSATCNKNHFVCSRCKSLKSHTNAAQPCVHRFNYTMTYMAQNIHHDERTTEFPYCTKVGQGKVSQTDEAIRSQEGRNYVNLILTDPCRPQTSVVSCALLTFCRNTSSSPFPVTYHGDDSAIGNTTTLAHTHLAPIFTRRSSAEKMFFMQMTSLYRTEAPGTALAPFKSVAQFQTSTL